jgi:hypothetical protein
MAPYNEMEQDYQTLMPAPLPSLLDGKSYISVCMRRLVEDLERAFVGITAGSYPGEWDEDHITYSLMRELRSLFDLRRIKYNGFEKIVHWLSYKNKGRTETQFGDISLIINIQFSSGERLAGVAFLEAKRDNARGNFEEIRIPQLERIVEHSPYAHLLLYVHQSQNLPLKFPDDTYWPSHIWASPINTALPKIRQLRPTDNKTVLRVSLPFSMLLTSRFFWGLDLDYREESFQIALAGSPDRRSPQYLGIINVFYDGQAPVGIALSDNWEQI